MNCRYCGNVYADEDRTCGGCGAPKHAFRQKIFDAPATPEHWSNSLKHTIYRVIAGTVGVVILIAVTGAVGLGFFGTILALFWIMPVVPCLLTYAAWRDAKGEWAGFFIRGFVVSMVWMTVLMVVLMCIGAAASL